MVSIMVMPRSVIRRYRSSMSSTRGVRWLMCVEPTPAISAATADTLDNSSYQDFDRFPRQRKRGHRRGDESRCVVGIAAAVSRDCPRLGEQRGVKELPAREEGLHSGA